jgi:hypothetical protein
MSASDYYDDDDRTVVGPYRGTMSDEVRARRAGYLAADFADRLDEDNFERMKTTRTTNPPSRRIALAKKSRVDAIMEKKSMNAADTPMKPRRAQTEPRARTATSPVPMETRIKQARIQQRRDIKRSLAHQVAAEKIGQPDTPQRGGGGTRRTKKIFSSSSRRPRVHKSSSSSSYLW